jgi:LPXTG-motif cell wall-anchored protein
MVFYRQKGIKHLSMETIAMVLIGFGAVLLGVGVFGFRNKKTVRAKG